MNINIRKLKKLFIIVTLIILLFTIYKIISTYSLLQSSLSGTVQQSIGKWNIELNKQDITNGITREIVINDFEFVEDSNVKSGKIAPRNMWYDRFNNRSKRYRCGCFVQPYFRRYWRIAYKYRKH